MKNKLEDYILTIPNVLTDTLCKKVIKELKKADWGDGNYYTRRKDWNKKSGCPSGTFDTLPSDQDIKNGIWRAIHKYVIEELKFHWFAHWDGFSALKFHRYKKNQFAEKHCDQYAQIFKKGIPILSIIGSLNNNYEGGELIFFKDKEYKLKAGEILMFPSNFLYPHKVMPVKKGARYTYVSWVY